MSLCRRGGVVRLALFLALFSVSGTASASVPDCMAHGQPLSINNEQILKYKFHGQDQCYERGYIEGRISRVFKDQGDHDHFEIKIGPEPRDTIEVVYNKAFGKLPMLRQGMDVTACGDYITARKRTDRYPASPSGAIIHWVHFSNDLPRHADGFLVINGQLYGDDNVNPRSNRPRNQMERRPNQRKKAKPPRLGRGRAERAPVSCETGKESYESLVVGDELQY